MMDHQDTNNIDSDAKDGKLLGHTTPHSRPPLINKKKDSRSHLVRTILSISTTLCLLLASFLAGALYTRSITHCDARFQEPTLAGAVPQVPLDRELRTFNLDPAFTKTPIPGENEPAWDSLIPNGLGYINSTSYDPPFSVLAAFHQLHCLYTLRRAYYSSVDPSSASTGDFEDFDFHRDRTQHVQHCFEYLRQSLMCAADSSVEPAEHSHEDGFLGWDVTRQCRDYEQLKRWAEQRRAFDGHGFLAEGLGRPTSR